MTGTQLTVTASIVSLLLAGGAFAQATQQPARQPLVSILRDQGCVQECRGELSACLEMVRQQFADCSEPCAELRTAAREACAANPQGDECREARAALRECVAPCEEKFRASVAECYAQARECIGECPPPADLACARRCHAQYLSCNADAWQNARACRERCRELIAEARRACTVAPDSDPCAQASAAARQCVAKCSRVLRSDLHECGKQLRMCLADCEGDETPAVAPRPAR